MFFSKLLQVIQLSAHKSTESAIQTYLQAVPAAMDEPTTSTEQVDIQPQLRELARRIQHNEFIDDEALAELSHRMTTPPATTVAIGN